MSGLFKTFFSNPKSWIYKRMLILVEHHKPVVGLLLWLSMVNAFFTCLGIFIDPGQFPRWVPTLLAFTTIAGGGIMLCFTLMIYLLESSQEGWRTDLARFVLLYLSLLLGFANLYYLIKGDFYVPTGKDQQLEGELASINNKYRDTVSEEKPEWYEAARHEFERDRNLEDDENRLALLIAASPQGKKIAADNGKRYPYIPNIMESDQMVDEMRVELKQAGIDREKLNRRLIEQYKDYLSRQAERIGVVKALRAEKAKFEYFNFVYFSAVTMSTVGYGDIYPATRKSKMAVTTQVLLNSTLILVYLSLIMGKAGRPTTSMDVGNR